jgi:tryptophan synthase beta chain
VEAGGFGITPGQHAATLSYGRPGVLHGSKSYVLQDEDGQTSLVHSLAAGLDYPGVGPEHSWLKEQGRVLYTNVTDEEALAAFRLCSETEGILPALESAHAVAYLMKAGGRIARESIVILCMSGRGDKDVYETAEKLGMKV